MPSADSMFRRTVRHAGVMDRRVRGSEDRYDDALARVAAKRAGVPFFRLDELLPESTEGGSPPQDSDLPSGVTEAVATTSAESGNLRFEDIVSPFSPEAFFAAQADRRHPVLFRGPARRASDLVTWRDLDRLIGSGRRDAAQIRLVMDAEHIPFSLFAASPEGQVTASSAFEPLQIDPRKLVAFLQQGATLIVDRIQRSMDRLADLAAELERGTRNRASINLYASWKSVQGFATHWDDHDVFVVQVRGEKDWRIYGVRRTSPMRFDVAENGPAPEKPLWSGRLTAGDVLFIPRGWWHDAQGDPAGRQASIHLTCSVRPRTGADMLAWLNNRMAEHELYRRELPLLAGEERWVAHVEALRGLLESVLSESPGPQLAQQLEDEFRSRWTERLGPRFGPSLDPWRGPHWDSHRLRLRGREHALLRRDAGGETLLLTANGVTLELAPYCLPLVEPLIAQDAVTVADLKRVDPDRFDGAFVDEFAKELLNRGIVAAVAPLQERG